MYIRPIVGQVCIPAHANSAQKVYDCCIALAAAAIIFSRRSSRQRGAGLRLPFRAFLALPGKPDFSGIWEANNTANWDLQTHEARPMVAQPGFTPNSVVLAAPVLALGAIGWVPAGHGVVEGERDSLPALGRRRKKENLEHWIDRDPEIKCFQPGVPRAMYMPNPFQIIQSATKSDGVRICERAAHHPLDQDGTVSEHGVHGIFDRPLGRRHAGGRRDGFHRCHLVRPGREFP